LTKGEPARPIRLSDPTYPFHASPLGMMADCSKPPFGVGEDVSHVQGSFSELESRLEAQFQYRLRLPVRSSDAQGRSAGNDPKVSFTSSFGSFQTIFKRDPLQ
jgi:hypothetical protein